MAKNARVYVVFESGTACMLVCVTERGDAGMTPRDGKQQRLRLRETIR